MDVGRAYSGMDQYQDSARHRVLCPADSNRSCISAHGEEYDEAGVCRVEYDLQSGPISKAPFPYEIPILNRCPVTGGAYGRFCNGIVGLHERAKKILVTPDHSRDGIARRVDRAFTGVGGRTVHLHVVLKERDPWQCRYSPTVAPLVKSDDRFSSKPG